MEMIGFLGRGIDHERRGGPCQDRIGSRSCGNGCRVYAISDGAGSAKYAAEAAQANINAVLDYFERYDLKTFIGLDPMRRRTEILEACRAALGRIGEFQPAEWVHLAATLLFFVWDGERWAAGHLGDGFFLVQDEAGGELLYSAPENAGKSNRTYFTVSPDAEDHLRICMGESEQIPGRLLMASDGPCGMFRTRGGSIRATALELLEYVREGAIRTAEVLADVLDQMTVYPLDRMDDWSVLIWSRSAAFSGESVLTEQSMLAREEKKYRDEEAGAEQRHP